MDDSEPDTLSVDGDAAGVVRLSLSVEEQWTLHHVLLDRIYGESATVDTDHRGPPPGAVVGAFETLDGGGTTFTVAQLEAVRSLLAAYHHSATWWEVERPTIEQLLHRVSAPLETA